MHRLLPALAAALSAVLVAACGGGASSAGSSPPPTAAAGGAAGQVVVITETEYKLDPAAISVRAGTITFQLQDKGQAPHDLHIAPRGSSAEIAASPRATAGGTSSLTVTLRPGAYDMWCGVPGHRGLGMQGTITVT